MDRPPLEVADLVRAAGDAFIERSRKWITWKHVKVLLAIARCRTAALGGHLDECKSGLGNCFVSIPNLKNLPTRLRISRMIAPSPRIQAIDLLASRLTL